MRLKLDTTSLALVEGGPGGGELPGDPGTPMNAGASLLVGTAAVYGIKKLKTKKQNRTKRINSRQSPVVLCSLQVSLSGLFTDFLNRRVAWNTGFIKSCKYPFGIQRSFNPGIADAKCVFSNLDNDFPIRNVVKYGISDLEPV